MILVVVLLCVLAWIDVASAADPNAYLSKIALADLFPGADRLGSPKGTSSELVIDRGYTA